MYAFLLLAVFAGPMFALPANAGTARSDSTRKGFLDTPFLIMMRSAVIPGWGQVSNHKYLKGAGIMALECSLGYMIYKENKSSNDYYNRHLRSSTYDEQVRLFDLYVMHYDRRNNYIWWLSGATLLSLVDAYVDAHLRGFDEEVNRETSLELAIVPREGIQTVAVVLSKKF